MPISRRARWCRSQNNFFYRSKGRKTNRINRTYRISRSKSSVYRVSSNLDLFVKFWSCVSSLAFLVQNYTNLCNPASFVQRISFRKLSHFKGFLAKILYNSVSQKFVTKAENRGNIFYTKSWFWICKKNVDKKPLNRNHKICWRSQAHLQRSKSWKVVLFQTLKVLNSCFIPNLKVDNSYSYNVIIGVYLNPLVLAA